MNRLTTLAALCALSFVPLAAQQATFTPFGAACTAPGEPTPAIGSRGLPQLGTTFEVTYRGPNRNSSAAQQRVQPVLITGLATPSAPLPILPGWFPQQPTGCYVFVLPIDAAPMPLSRSGTSYESSLALTVPNDPNLLGAAWFHQWVTMFQQCGFAGCNVFWVVTSDAARAVAGT